MPPVYGDPNLPPPPANPYDGAMPLKRRADPREPRPVPRTATPDQPNKEKPVRNPWTVCRRFAPMGLSLAILAVTGLPMAIAAQTTSPTPPSTVRPGPPGASTASLDASELRAPSRARHTEAEVVFMQHMIVHHRQALTMSEMVPARSERRDVRSLADRIERSQAAEIAFMERWLELRGEPVEADLDGGHHGHHDPHDGHDHHGDHAHHGAHGQHGAHAPADAEHRPMAGMLTEGELAQLAAADGEEFDQLFLTFMIMHHEGALIMVDELFDSPEAVLDTDIFDLASHILSDQLMEIARMRDMLEGGA
ncbi:MAG: DUF305 domain-containing protein [Gemmatimonadales bacterium]|nr:MAG: DUF305 domain-containing protein [Gemmatimonadales bacterium]